MDNKSNADHVNRLSRSVSIGDGTRVEVSRLDLAQLIDEVKSLRQVDASRRHDASEAAALRQRIVDVCLTEQRRWSEWDTEDTMAAFVGIGVPANILCALLHPQTSRPTGEIGGKP